MSVAYDILKTVYAEQDTPNTSYNKRTDVDCNSLVECTGAKLDLQYIDNINIYREKSDEKSGGASFDGDILVIC